MRRVVTGPGAGGAAIVLDGEPPTAVEFGQYRTTELWVTDTSPPAVVRAGDPSARAWELEPPPGGSCFRIVQIAPEAAGGDASPSAPGEDGADAATAGDSQDAGPGFLAEHTTDTLDYLVVISGEVTLTVGASQVTLGPGDTVVQQGVAHDWRNTGAEPCVMAGVLISTR
jgi:mannose-6-phosphate isomerase-like protein (cupin superfamily)